MLSPRMDGTALCWKTLARSSQACVGVCTGSSLPLSGGLLLVRVLGTYVGQAAGRVSLKRHCLPLWQHGSTRGSLNCKDGQSCYILC